FDATALADLTPMIVGVIMDVVLHSLIGHIVPIIGVVITGLLWKSRYEKIKQTIRDELTKALSGQMRQAVRKASIEIKDQIDASIGGLRKRITENIDEQIAGIDASLKSIRDQKSSAQFSADTVRQRLDGLCVAIEETISRVQHAMSSLIQHAD